MMDTIRNTAAAVALAASLVPAHASSLDALKAEVADTERAFAKTMAMRDHAGFVSFLAPEAIFFSGNKALRGKDEVATAWKRFYESADAPFSWEPDQVEVLATGQLAHSSGPVREAPGKWRIVFDKGEQPPCNCAKP